VGSDVLDEDVRPTAVLVMAEYGVEDPVWDRPHGHRGEISLADLGVSESLVRRLREWNATFERSPRSDELGGPAAISEWVRRGLHLAYDLQWELPDVEVRYAHAGDDRPLRSH